MRHLRVVWCFHPPCPTFNRPRIPGLTLRNALRIRPASFALTSCAVSHPQSITLVQSPTRHCPPTTTARNATRAHQFLSHQVLVAPRLYHFELRRSYLIQHGRRGLFHLGRCSGVLRSRFDRLFHDGTLPLSRSTSKLMEIQ